MVSLVSLSDHVPWAIKRVEHRSPSLRDLHLLGYLFSDGYGVVIHQDRKSLLG